MKTEQLREIVSKPIRIRPESLGDANNLIDFTVKQLSTLISQERAEAKAEARMELEVEIGLQKLGQLMQEKEKIRAEAVGGFVDFMDKVDATTTDRDGFYMDFEQLIKEYLKASEEKE